MCKKTDYIILHPVTGITFDDLVKYDTFVLGNYETIEKYIENTYRNIKKDGFVATTFKKSSKDNSFIGIILNANTPDEAKDLARNKMKNIESILRVFAAMANAELCDIGIFDFKNPATDFMCIISKDGIRNAFSITGARLPIKWSEFHNKCGLYLDKLLKIMTTDSPNNIEQRITLATIFLGRAVYDSSQIIGFLEVIMAIEALLGNGGKGSIISTIAEYCAFLIGTTLEERKRIDKNIRELYKIRSDIAHGKKHKIEGGEYQKIWNVAITLIDKFLTDDKIMNMTEFSQLQNYIVNLKYSTKEQTNG